MKYYTTFADAKRAAKMLKIPAEKLSIEVCQSGDCAGFYVFGSPKTISKDNKFLSLIAKAKNRPCQCGSGQEWTHCDNWEMSKINYCG